MSVKLRASSGSYNVRASELQSQTPRPSVTKSVQCEVFFLDETKATFHIDVSLFILFPVTFLLRHDYMSSLIQILINL